MNLIDQWILREIEKAYKAGWAAGTCFALRVEGGEEDVDNDDAMCNLGAAQYVDGIRSDKCPK